MGPQGSSNTQSGPFCSPCSGTWKGWFFMWWKGSRLGLGGATGALPEQPTWKPPNGERPNLGSWRGGGARQKGKGSKGQAGWQQWRGKFIRPQESQDGNHTINTSNYWSALQRGRTLAVCPGGQGLQGTDEEPFVPIRNSLFLSKGRNPAPSGQVSQCASWGGGSGTFGDLSIFGASGT